MANQMSLDKASQAAVHGGKKGHSLFKEVFEKLTGKRN